MRALRRTVRVLAPPDNISRGYIARTLCCEVFTHDPVTGHVIDHEVMTDKAFEELYTVDRDVQLALYEIQRLSHHARNYHHEYC